MLDEGAGISWASSLVAFGALVAITSVMVTIFYGQTRIFFAMARDGLISRQVAKINPRTGTPMRLTYIMGFFIALLAAFVPLSEIVKLVNIGTLFAFLLVNIGVIILRRTQPDMERPFRVPFVPVFPIIGMLPDHLPDDRAALGHVGAVRGLAGDRPGDLLLLRTPQLAAADRQPCAAAVAAASVDLGKRP